MRIVLDTNVLMSGAFFSGPPSKILGAWADCRFDLLATVEILGEYRRVRLRCRRTRATTKTAISGQARCLTNERNTCMI